ncbi:MAG: BrnT family toxin [Deltaproteobacteria bacterium]|nr:BrnT family toxin [Deltaproteobacteria bacterium]
MEFEWDPKKDKANRRKHGISFHEAATVFGDPLAISFPDPDHSLNEERFLIFGISIFNQLLVVSYAQRDDKYRIISARLMTRQERKIYEEG